MNTHNWKHAPKNDQAHWKCQDCGKYDFNTIPDTSEACPPTEIKGTPIRPIQGSEVEFNGQTWITLIPSEGEDSRIWEFSLTTGKIVQTAS